MDTSLLVPAEAAPSAPPAEPEPAAPVRRARPLAWRLLFTCLLGYLLLYGLPFPLDRVSEVLPRAARESLAWATTRYEAGERAASEWFGRTVLGYDDAAKIERTGSGDTRFDYVRVALLGCVALLLAVCWSLLDRRGRTLPAAHVIVHTYVRYLLAVTMLAYGFHKVWPLQFGALDDERLFGTYGGSSPMHLLWTFMAASPAYTIFGGASEVLGGALLLFRRTTLLGALVSAAVLTNVVMLNLCYDVPVKLYSTHLLVLALFLAARDGNRLLALFVLDRPTAPARPRRAPLPAWGLAVLELAVAGWCLWQPIAASRQAWASTRAQARTPLEGIWEVREFAHELPADAAPAPGRAWQRISFSRHGFAVLTRQDGSKEYRRVAVDDGTGQVTLTAMGADAPPPLVLACEHRDVPAADAPADGASASGAHAAASEGVGAPGPAAERTAAREACFTGTLDGAELKVVARWRDPDTFPIRARGFRWVQPYPYNANR